MHYFVSNFDTAFISFFTCGYLIQSYGSCEPVRFSFEDVLPPGLALRDT